jgi:hypothetical protein
LKEECAKECKEMGGDEIYRNKPLMNDKGSYMNFSCCLSKTPEQKEKVEKKDSSCGLSCILVNQILDD